MIHWKNYLQNVNAIFVRLNGIRQNERLSFSQMQKWKSIKFNYLRRLRLCVRASSRIYTFAMFYSVHVCVKYTTHSTESNSKMAAVCVLPIVFKCLENGITADYGWLISARDTTKSRTEKSSSLIWKFCSWKKSEEKNSFSLFSSFIGKQKSR